MKPCAIFILVSAALLFQACKHPEAAFTMSQTAGNTGDTIFFYNTSMNASSYEWEFGDGEGSVEENPLHIYQSGDFYTVRLTASDENESDVASASITIKDATGTLLHITIHSGSLEDNLLGDSPERAVSVYLPTGYFTDTLQRYPVLYLLHGWSSDNDAWFGTSIGNLYGGLDVSKLMDQKINEGSISPMIIVAPNGNNSYSGCWYTNSSVSGNWEDFIVNDLVTYVDNHFRTLTKAESRGIAGHSMGGFGAISIALKHPDIFNAVYSLSAGDLVFDDLPVIFEDEFIAAAFAENFDDQSIDVKLIISQAVAYAPHAGALPFPADLPVDRDGNLIESVWETWLLHDPVSFLSNYLNNPSQLSAIQFDCGSDDMVLPINTDFSEKLTTFGIDHIYETYDGDHTNRIAERMNTKVLPFFSTNLKSE